MVQFLHALQRMPALTHLDLEDSIPDNSGGPSTYPVADLPYLRVLRISSCVDAMTAVLAHITFPSQVELNLICKETESTQSDFSTFLSILVAKFLSSLVIRSLSLEDLDNTTTQSGFILKVWSTTAVHNSFFIPTPPRLELELIWPTPLPSEGSPRKYAKALTATCDAMNLRALTQLELSTSYYIDVQTWLETFARLSLLERVHVLCRAARSFIDALFYKLEAADASIAAYRTVSFPGLRYICMEGAGFTDGISVYELMDCLMERYERNAEVQELCLEDCFHISATEVERLREIVVHVDWDKVEQTFSDWDAESYSEEESDSDRNEIFTFY
ncbi:hypothetical protein BYT27DRAFT_7195765 [Phlegmacium glaucopus]|nr:hypothetical protein BYT27DRAFT_7195765 [Phlegmacium glaucopus]